MNKFISKKSSRIVRLNRSMKQFSCGHPSYKPKLGITQANFEMRNAAKGAWQSNGHLDIIK